MNLTINNIPIHQIEADFLAQKNVELFILREDLIHSTISGNKWRKLKYNVIAAKENGFDTLLTFGGAYSNHIAATAAAGKEFGLNTIGIIRGEEVNNSTLILAKKNGMELRFVSREEYKKISKGTIEPKSNLRDKYLNAYIIPEGGSNRLAIKGCTEIVNGLTIDYDIICCACGTGGTIAGIICSTDKTVLGFPALKGGAFLKEDIQRLIESYDSGKEYSNWQLITDYHFGGYAKVKPELVDFIGMFKKEHNILLDFIYTGKMVFGLYDKIKNSNQFNNKKIVIVHTGGVQGNKGFEERFGIRI